MTEIVVTLPSGRKIRMTEEEAREALGQLSSALAEPLRHLALPSGAIHPPCAKDAERPFFPFGYGRPGN